VAALASVPVVNDRSVQAARDAAPGPPFAEPVP